MISKYNDPKRIYIVYKRETHEYLQELGDFGYFCTCRLFLTHELARKTSVLNKGSEVLEIELTKWSCKEIR